MNAARVIDPATGGVILEREEAEALNQLAQVSESDLWSFAGVYQDSPLGKVMRAELRRRWRLGL
jgi:hypothetical protein